LASAGSAGRGPSSAIVTTLTDLDSSPDLRVILLSTHTGISSDGWRSKPAAYVTVVLSDSCVGHPQATKLDLLSLKPKFLDFAPNCKLIAAEPLQLALGIICLQATTWPR